MYIGDWQQGATVEFKFNTVDANGAPITLAGSPVVKIKKDAGTTEYTDGVTLSVDHNGTVGHHHVTIYMPANTTLYLGGDYFAYLTAGTVNGISVVGTVLAHWSVVNRIVGGVYKELDTYQADIDVVDDNAGTTDRYVVVWRKNGKPILTAITSPTIQVWKQTDGTNLIASTALTEIGTTKTYKYNAVTTERIVNGVGYVAKVTADIDGVTRVDTRIIGRDS